jgi:ADP-L-glycero-D-manno-heptose 6-epimerase
MIIVTGGAGFIGTNLVRSLLELGKQILVVEELDKYTKKFDNLKSLDILDCLDHNIFIKDLLDGKYENKIDQIFHLGACSKTTEPDRDYIMDVNFNYSKKLLEYSANNNIDLIYASSASVYGDGTIFKEDLNNESSLNHYSESKLLFDNYVRENMTKIKSQIVGMRYFNVYGPYEHHKEVMSSVAYHFYNQFKQYGMLKLFKGSHGYDDGEQRRDFVYVKDTIDVKLWFMQNNYSGIFNVATGKSRSFNDVAKSVINYFNSGYIEYINFPRGLEAQYQAFTEADMSNLRNRGYQRETTELEDGVSSYMKFLDEN